MCLCKVIKKGRKQISIEDGSKIVAKDPSDEWIQRKVYPMHKNNVTKKIKCDYERFKFMSNQFTSERYRKTQNWHERAIHFNKYMTNHTYAIRTKCRECQKRMSYFTETTVMATC